MMALIHNLWQIKHMENTVLVKDRLAHIADVLARYIAILGLCMVPWSTSLDQLPYVSLLLSLLIGQAISTSGTQIITHRIGQITLLLIAVLSASTLSSVASRHFAWHQWLKYVPKLILFMLLPGLFTEAKHRMQAIHALRNMVCITCILYWAHCHHWINLAKWLHKPSLIEVINPIPFSSIVAYTTMICFDLYRKRGNAMYLLTAAIGLQHLIWMNPKRTGLLAFAVLLAFHCIRNIRLKPHQYWSV